MSKFINPFVLLAHAGTEHKQKTNKIRLLRNAEDFQGKPRGAQGNTRQRPAVEPHRRQGRNRACLA